MRRYVLDTGVASDVIYRRGSAPTIARERINGGAAVGIALPAVGELFAGVEYSQTRDANRIILVRNLSSLKLWPFDRQAAQEFGRLFAQLKRIGRPMPQIDIQIAAVATSLGNCTVVTKDSDFAAIPGLAVEDWSKL
jgi:tRNA(fMet)-specific endonuclease VapC